MWKGRVGTVLGCVVEAGGEMAIRLALRGRGGRAGRWNCVWWWERCFLMGGLWERGLESGMGGLARREVEIELRSLREVLLR